MKVRIQSQGFALTPTISAHAHKRLDALLNRYDEEVISVDVYLKDLNGPKGGYDKQAIMRVQLRHLPPVSISTTRTDLYKSIDVSVRRLLRSVRRTVTREKLIIRRGLQYLAAVAGDA